jgi:hypothetical protein
MQTRPFDRPRHSRDTTGYQPRHRRPQVGVEPAIERQQQLAAIADGFELRIGPMPADADDALERPYSADCAFAHEGPLYGAGTGATWGAPGPDTAPTIELRLDQDPADTAVMSIALHLALDEAPDVEVETVIVEELPDGYTATTIRLPAAA